MNDPKNEAEITRKIAQSDEFVFDDGSLDLNAEINAPVKAPAKVEKDHFWRTISIFIFFVLVLRLFVIDPFLVHGSSMQPTFEDGNYVIVDKLTYKLSAPKRGDVVVFDAPTEDGRYFIKRIIGLPGEKITVDGTSVQIFNAENPNGFELKEPYVVYPSGRVTEKTLASDEYFVMGDNREVSSDSRIWGALKAKAITGRALVRILPFKNATFFPGDIKEFDGVAFPLDSKSTETAK